MTEPAQDPYMDDADRAQVVLDLATRLNEVAKSVPIRIDDLLALMEPPWWILRTTLDGKGTEPAEAARQLRSLESLRKQRKIREALTHLIPSKKDRDVIVRCRTDLADFYDRVSRIPRDTRQGDLDLQDSLKAGGNAILDRWPESPFAILLGDTGDDLFRSVLKDDEWLVSLEGDGGQHGPLRELREILQRDGCRLDSVSPFRVWRSGPVGWRRGWYWLKDRMRLGCARWKGSKEDARRSPGRVREGGEVRVHDKDAAPRLGTSPWQLSRWRNRDVVPTWAKSDPVRFKRLIQAGSKEKLREANVEELVEWRRESTKKAVEGAGRGEKR